MIFNMVGGGGSLSATDAVLRVIAPAGSTVTISKGAVSKSDQGHENASDTTLYDYYFIIHASQFDSVNPWTVTATLGTQSMSDTVIIDSADEYSLVLTYTLYIVQSGTVLGDSFVKVGKKLNSSTSAGSVTPTETVGTTYTQWGVAASSGGAFGIAYSPDKYELSKYSKIHLIGTAKCEDATTSSHLGVYVWSEIGTYIIDNLLFNEAILNSNSSSFVSVDKSFNISSLTYSAYVGFCFGKTGSYSSYVRVTDLYLEV